MKNLTFIFFLLILTSCSRRVVSSYEEHEKNMPSNMAWVEKIKRQHNWYIIIADRNDTLFSILSKRSTKNYSKCCNYPKIKKYHEYPFHIILDQPRAIPGFEMIAVIDSVTQIKMGPKEGFYQIDRCTNLNGLYLVPDSLGSYVRWRTE